MYTIMSNRLSFYFRREYSITGSKHMQDIQICANYIDHDIMRHVHHNRSCLIKLHRLVIKYCNILFQNNKYIVRLTNKLLQNTVIYCYRITNIFLQNTAIYIYRITILFFHLLP